MVIRINRRPVQNKKRQDGFKLEKEVSCIIVFFQMSGVSKIGKFINKLEALIREGEFESIIKWDEARRAIEITDMPGMEKEVLPKFFRHHRFDSFVRQLNIYGFKKLKRGEAMAYTHPLLQEGQPITSISAKKTDEKKKPGAEVEPSERKDSAESEGASGEPEERALTRQNLASDSSSSRNSEGLAQVAAQQRPCGFVPFGGMGQFGGMWVYVMTPQGPVPMLVNPYPAQ